MISTFKRKDIMIEKVLFNTRSLSAHTTNDNRLSIEMNEGIIKGVSICITGEALGHGLFLEDSFIKDLVKQGSEMKAGVKARFGHPSFFSDGIGSFVGTFNNFRISDDGQKAIADLELSQVAKSSPAGDLYSYVLDLAKSHPTHFGTSIVNHNPKFYQYSDEGKKLEIKTYSDYRPKEKLFMAIGEFTACDLVDEPAANDGLFSISNYNSLKMNFKNAITKMFASDNGEGIDPPALEVGVPSIGDSITLKNVEGKESLIPDGEFIISSGDLAENILIVKAGEITEIKSPMTNEDPEKLSREAVEKLPMVQQLQALVAKQQKVLDSTPAGQATTVISKGNEFNDGKKFKATHLANEAREVSKYQIKE